MGITALITRINELAKKKRTHVLTHQEMREQKELYEIYLQNIRRQVKNQLDKIEVVDIRTTGH